MNLKQILNKVPRTKRTFGAGLIIFTIMAIAAFFGYLTLRDSKQRAQTAPLTQEQLIKLIKPSVVRIIQHDTGTITVPGINVNFNSQNITAATDSSATLNVDEYISGSGSIITPDGYILTNSHVVSTQTIKIEKLLDYAGQVAKQKAAGLSDADYNKTFPSDTDFQNFVYNIADFLVSKAQESIRQDITVLNPSVSKRHLQDLLDNGFPATVVDVNDNFSIDQRDVAVIKINQINLPSLKLSEANNVSVGDKIYVLGFPATAEFNDQNFSEPTLTSGVVSAAKFNDDKNFKVYQTDAKISEGSSGGPMFNDQGEVIGLVTFETGQQARAAGDNFAFAVPVSLGQEMLAKNNIFNIPGDYAGHFRQALNYINHNQCKTALNELAIARTSNNYFSTYQYIKPYQDQCQELINNGKSQDSWWVRMGTQLRDVNAFTWFVVIGRILLLSLGGLIFWVLIERLHKDEREINKLESEIEEVTEEKTLTSFGTPLPLPEENVYSFSRNGTALPNSELLQYVREAKAVGLSEDLIKSDLLKAGWKDSDIEAAFKHI